LKHLLKFLNVHSLTQFLGHPSDII
jgi:hypothetical protein